MSFAFLLIHWPFIVNNANVVSRMTACHERGSQAVFGIYQAVCAARLAKVANTDYVFLICHLLS